MSIASEIALQIEELEDQNAHLHGQLEHRQRDLEEVQDSLCEIEEEFCAFIAYAESITPGIRLAYKAQKELTR
jgi:predicted nuclease with TOPRIM domain